MKKTLFNAQPLAPLRSQAGFTVTEMAVVSLLFALILGSIIGLAVLTLRLSSGTTRQMELDSQARVVNLLVSEVKSSQLMGIYNYDGATFTSVPVGKPQVGNALSLTVANANGSTKQVIYYVNSQGQLFRSVLNGGSAKLWIDDITSSAPFSARDYTGTVLTVPSQKMLIDLRLTGVDANTQDFRQTITRQVTVGKRN
jgi:hypothetical protein